MWAASSCFLCRERGADGEGTSRSYRNVTYDYFKDMIEINVSFYKSARKIIQAAKRDYRNFYGKSVTYNRVYTDRPLGFDKSIPTKKSAKVQGIKGDIGLNSENGVKSNE